MAQYKELEIVPALPRSTEDELRSTKDLLDLPDLLSESVTKGPSVNQRLRSVDQRISVDMTLKALSHGTMHMVG